MTFGEKIQKLRKEAGLSQEELAYQLGVSRQAVSKWESGAAVPELDKLMVDLCIGCGTCSYVCPAKRPVTQTMNLAKAVWQKNKNGGKK